VRAYYSVNQTSVDPQWTAYYGTDIMMSEISNFPNPFNPSTKFSYHVKEDGIVSLKIFDNTGRQVATIVDGYVPKGRYEVEWDASQLSSGIYFYRFQRGYTSITHKLLLVK
jgi:hypothetical protein